MNRGERLSSYIPPGDTGVRVISVVRVFQLVHKAVYPKTRYCYQPPLLSALCLGRILKMASNDSGEPWMMWSPATRSSRPVTGRHFPSTYKPQNTRACDTRRRTHCCTVCNTLLLVRKTILFVKLQASLFSPSCPGPLGLEFLYARRRYFTVGYLYRPWLSLLVITLVGPFLNHHCTCTVKYRYYSTFSGLWLDF